MEPSTKRPAMPMANKIVKAQTGIIFLALKAHNDKTTIKENAINPKMSKNSGLSQDILFFL
jgi:hypothetical protein